MTLNDTPFEDALIGSLYKNIQWKSVTIQSLLM